MCPFLRAKEETLLLAKLARSSHEATAIRQVMPRRAGAQDPQHPVEHRTRVTPRAAAAVNQNYFGTNCGARTCNNLEADLGLLESIGQWRSLCH